MVKASGARRAAAADGIDYLLWRHELDDGQRTTVYAVRHPARSTRVRVVHFPRARRLDVWCARERVDEAIVGGFFVRDPYRALGEVWVGGERRRHEPAADLFRPKRACVAVGRGGVRMGPRDGARPGSAGDLLQAGPLLVEDYAIVFDPRTDEEGFSQGAAQFDSDITDGRYPRAALGLGDDWLVAVACDGRRSRVDAGLSMLELARVMVDLGVRSAINLDGGGSTTLVHRGHLLNRPYATQDQPAPQTRRVVTALVFERRR
jgi:hypothetical protein